MLTSIYIENYALIDRLEIDFASGLSIVTGETGAGKSILLGALGLLLGKRADTTVLKDQNRECVVEGIFSIEEYELEGYFKENDLDYTPETIFRREISSNGKSRAFINDTPVNLAQLQDLSLKLIDIHSQHQNLLLNNTEYILWIIDSFAGSKELRINYEAAYHEYHALEKKYQQVKTAFEKDKENLDYHNHQFQELRDANLNVNEMEELELELDVLGHAEEIKSSLNSSAFLFHDEESGIIGKLKEIKDLLSKISTHYPAALEFLHRTDASYIDLKDVAEEIHNHFERLDYDPERMEFISNRIHELHNLLRKNKKDNLVDLIALRDELDIKLQQMSVGDYELGKLADELKTKKEHMMSLAESLSGKRQSIFEEFSGRVTGLLEKIALQHASFTIQHRKKEPGEAGIDAIEFLFSANKNSSMQPVNKVASGGELSRLMLAIKYLISRTSGLPVIIFDEIDTGVSGEIADMVGNLIKTMSEKMQVINITHLPQVASKGNHHYLVYKQNDDGESKTHIRELNKEERLQEIAKMLSGDTVTAEAIENARVLLK